MNKIKSFFSNPITITVIILISIGIVLIGYKKWGWFQAININKGTSPNPNDCAGARYSGDIIAGRPACTKPTYSWNSPEIKEVCFTYDKLGVSAGEDIPEKKWIRKGFFDLFPTEYFLNRQSVDKYCYINNADLFATCLEEFPENPKSGDRFIKCNQHYIFLDNAWSPTSIYK